jgi:hypothetical protein
VGVPSVLGTGLLAAPVDAIPDANFTADRAQLPARLGGAGFSLLSNRHLYLDLPTKVLPQLVHGVESSRFPMADNGDPRQL